MLILGVDPGTICTGFGVVKFKGDELFRVASGVIDLPQKEDISVRLNLIYDGLVKVINKYNPDEFSLETAFYGKNVQSALKIGYARGAAMLAAVKSNLAVNEYSPREVKKSLVGNGAATKTQVQFMVNKLMYIREENIKFDETDALAVAVCHAFKRNTPKSSGGSWVKFVKDNPGRIIE